jgi:hypothetical protein
LKVSRSFQERGFWNDKKDSRTSFRQSTSFPKNSRDLNIIPSNCTLSSTRYKKNQVQNFKSST